MIATEVIRKKRDGEELTAEEIEYFIRGFSKREITNYQMAAFLMAVYIRGMSFRETTDLTRAMMESGKVLDLSFIPHPKVDKHSTGGVGDKISLILAPLLASLGVVVPMISGRALEHTGGTLDKLESIPGFRTNLEIQEFQDLLVRVGVAIIGQTRDIVPADRGMYALRDATATVSSVPLIASSIMAKKLAEGVDAVLLDVKVGSGAFMREERVARELGEAMVKIGKGMGKRVMALLTNMDEPLGRTAGNRVEVSESVDVLKGRGPDDVKELTLVLGAHLLTMVGLSQDLEGAKDMEREALSSGRAYRKWEEMVRGQGGDPEAVLEEDFTEAPFSSELKSPRDGIVLGFDTRKVGYAVTTLGGGRFRLDEKVDPRAGVIFYKKVGDEVMKGEPLLEVRTSREESIDTALSMLDEAISIGSGEARELPLVLGVVS